MRVLAVLSGIGGLLLVAACGSPAASMEPPVQAGKQFTMRVDNSMQFGTRAIEVQAGQPFELTLDNEGNMPHDFTLDKGVAQPVKIEANGHESAKATFTIDKPGTYEFVCSQPGHGLAGMRGTIVAR